ncbi:MAG: hypothetical protein QOH86_1609 [Sphingomonadales bacterium]|jgi:hypothetical protein|nr:hypothetical protein [Sphingomonadales bacterium]
MPTLDEYLGGIFASLTRARMIADSQAVTAAETYARHDLLRHFAVPHLRFSEVELTIPVAIESVQPPPQGIIDPAVRDALRNGILAGLARPFGMRQFTRPAADILNARIDAAIDRLAERGAGRPLGECLAEFARDLATDIASILASIGIDPKRVATHDVAEVAREVAEAHVKSIPPAAGLGSLHIVAESHRLREERPSDVIVIKMSVSEEGMEWHQMETSDGRTERKLLPE